MRRPSSGHTVTVSTQGEPFQAFVPAPLPPTPPIEWSAGLRRRFDDALVALGRLDAVSSLLPNAQLVLYSFVRKEAVLLSQIEGTQSSRADLMLFEIDEQPGVPLEDAQEVSRCVAAMAHGVERLRGGFPLSLRLLREMHGVLLDHPRGRGKTPANFAALRSSWAARGQATPRSCHRQPTTWANASTPSSVFCTTSPSPPRPCCARRWPMFSSRRSTPFSTATAASAAR